MRKRGFSLRIFLASFSMCLAVCCSGVWSFAACAAAVDYPARPIRYVIPAAPGGNADIIGRLVAERLTANLNQQVVVENRIGASNIMGTEYVVKSAPDGYMLMQVASAHFTNPSMVKKLPYDTVRDLAPISMIGSTPLVLVTHPSLPVKSVSDLIALAKARPGELNFSTTGVGSSAHLAGALLVYLAHVNVIHVPYKGTTQSLTDVISGDLHFAFPSLTSGLQLVRTGKLKSIAITSLKRSALAPSLPTIAESGVPGYQNYQASIWTGLLVPAATPVSIVAKLNTEVVRILSAPEIRERFASAGADIAPSSPQEADEFIRTEIKKWAEVTKAAGIKAE